MNAARGGATPSSGAGPFPLTRHSVIDALEAPDADVRRQAWETLISAYWRPVYKHLRCSWNIPSDDAEDLTQEFFARLLDGGVLERFEPARARFRTYLRVCLDRFTTNARKAEARLKRGGGHTHLSLDFPGAERELGASLISDDDADEAFRREMIRSLFVAAVEALRARCLASGKATQFAIFERYDRHDVAAAGEAPTYATLAAEFGVPVTQVTNSLAAMRRAFRANVLEELRAITATDAEFHAEARELFGVEPT